MTTLNKLKAKMPTIKELDAAIEKYEKECEQLLAKIRLEHGAALPPDNYYRSISDEVGLGRRKGGLH